MFSCPASVQGKLTRPLAIVIGVADHLAGRLGVKTRAGVEIAGLDPALHLAERGRLELGQARGRLVVDFNLGEFVARLKLRMFMAYPQVGTVDPLSMLYAESRFRLCHVPTRRNQSTGLFGVVNPNHGMLFQNLADAVL